jgi:hypothetical protein
VRAWSKGEHGWGDRSHRTLARPNLNARFLEIDGKPGTARMGPEAHDQPGIFLRLEMFARSRRTDEFEERGRIARHPVHRVSAATAGRGHDLRRACRLESFQGNQAKHALTDNLAYASHVAALETRDEGVDRPIRNRLASRLGGGRRRRKKQRTRQTKDR